MAPLPASTERSAPWRDRRTWAVVAAVGAVVARGLLDPSGSLLGHVFSEAPGHLWMQWLLDRAMWGESDWFGQRDVLLKETLWVVPLDWANRFVAFALGPLLGAVLTFNVTVTGLIVLMAVGIVRVCRQLDAGPRATALAVLLFVWSPSVLGFAADGRIDSLGQGWMALFLAAWLEAMRRPTWRSGIWMGMWAMLVALSGPNAALVLAVLAAVPSLIAFARKPARFRPLVVTVVMAAGALWFVVGTLYSVEQNDPMRLEQVVSPESRMFLEFLSREEVEGRQLKAVWSGAANLNRFAPHASMWSLPEELPYVQVAGIGPARLTLQSYAPGGWWRLSIVPWVLALVGFVRRPRLVAPWLGFGAVTLFLGLGHGYSQTLPFVVGDSFLYISPATVIEKVPGLHVFNNYGLFSSVSAFFIAVAVAVGWRGARFEAAVAGLAAVAWFAEVQRGPVPLPLATADTELPDGLVEMLRAGDPKTGVVTLPLSKDHNNYLQTLHGRPTPVRFRLQQHSPDREGMIADPTGNLNVLLSVARGRGPDPTLERRLVTAEVGHVLVLSHLMSEERQQQVRARISGALGSPVWTDGANDLYVVRH